MTDGGDAQVDTEGSPAGVPWTGAPTEELSAVAPEGVRRGVVGRHKRMVVASAAVVLAIAAGIGIWLGTSGGSPEAGLHVTTQVVSVTTGTIKETVSASGTIEPAQESALDFAVSGKVTAVDVVVGQKVAAGQTLATVGATALEAQEAAAQASLSAAESKLSADESTGVSTSELATDEAAVTSAKDQYTTAEKALSDAELTSPIAGTVASVDLSVGEEVSGSGSGSGSLGDASHANGGSTTSSGPSSSSTEIEVVSTDTFVVNTTVDDTEVAKVSTGDQAVITPTGSTTDVYGTVASVGMVATNSGGVPSFPVAIDVTGTPSGVYAGSGADVSIVVKQLNDVLEVPSAAISYKGSQATVTVLENGGRHVSQPVTVGTTNAGETQITRGLHAGEKLVEREVTFTGPSGTRTFARSGGFPGGGRPGGGRFILRTGSGSGAFGTGGLGD